MLEDISELGQNSNALSPIAQAAEQLGSTYVGQEVLTSIITPASNPGNYMLEMSAYFSGRLGQLDQEGEETLREIRQKARQLRVYEATSALAISYARLGKWDQALGTLIRGLGWFSPWTPAEILTLWAEAHNPNLVSGAVILAVNFGESTNNSTQFVVDIKSPDTDCENHADWWEVVSPEGELLYRQLIPDVHGYERPFTLTSDPIPLPPTQPVVIRAHLHQLEQELSSQDDLPTGYADYVLYGTVESGFKGQRLSTYWAKQVEQLDPQPSTCQARP
jgi:hypothetical protein